MSNLGRMRRKSTKSAYAASRAIRYNNSGNRSVTIKKPVKHRTFLEYALMEGNIMLVADNTVFLKSFKSGKNRVNNSIFKNLRAEKLGLVYSPKRKWFMWLALTDDGIIDILFRDTELYQLPEVSNINLEKLDRDVQVLENINRLLVSVYYHHEIRDLTYNPVCNYGIMELFKK